MTNNLKPGERLDDLQIKGYEIIQSPGAVLLRNGCSAFKCLCQSKSGRMRS